MKQCTKCKKWKNESEFYKGRGDCKDCKKNRSRDLYAPVKQSVREKRAATYQGDLKQCKECGEWKHVSCYVFHPDHWDKLSHVCKDCTNARTQERHRENPDKHNKKSQQWYQQNREKKLAKASQWRKANKDKSRAIWHRYKARKLSVEGDFTDEQWQRIVEYYCPDDRCLCCGKKHPLAADHVVPLNIGGENRISNIQPLCQPCNSKKGCRLAIDYRHDKGAYARSLVGTHESFDGAPLG